MLRTAHGKNFNIIRQAQSVAATKRNDNHLPPITIFISDQNSRNIFCCIQLLNTNSIKEIFFGNLQMLKKELEEKFKQNILKSVVGYVWEFGS